MWRCTWYGPAVMHMHQIMHQQHACLLHLGGVGLDLCCPELEQSEYLQLQSAG